MHLLGPLVSLLFGLGVLAEPLKKRARLTLGDGNDAFDPAGSINKGNMPELGGIHPPSILLGAGGALAISHLLKSRDAGELCMIKCMGEMVSLFGFLSLHLFASIG